MFDVIVSKAVHDILTSLSTARKYQFDPQPLFRAAAFDTLAKTRFKRNVTTFMNSSKYKSIIKMLEKELMLALMKN